MYILWAVGEERVEWSAEAVRALRRRLGMTQREMADELGARQQTISEWETGVYRPRGVSARTLLRMAESAGAPYRAGASDSRDADDVPAERGEGDEGPPRG